MTRSIGFAIIRLDRFFTIDEVVFAENGDLVLLGATTLEGMHLVIDPRRRKPVAAGPIPAAAAGPGRPLPEAAEGAGHAPLWAANPEGGSLSSAAPRGAAAHQVPPSLQVPDSR